MITNPENEWFGHRHVSPEEKTAAVHGVFDNVAPRYDVMNDVMSAGIHRLWKRRFISTLRPRAGDILLDVAGGTGDITFGYRKRYGHERPVIVCDLTPAMLAEGRNRALNYGYTDISWVSGNAEALPLPDRSVDLYTIAFGLRNVTHIDTALAEAYRVLRTGGKFFCLEFSKVLVPGFDKLYALYSKHIIPRMGQAIAKDRDSYQYLVESIERFPSQGQLKRRIEAAGFQNVSVTNLSGGIAAIHSGLKV